MNEMEKDIEKSKCMSLYFNRNHLFMLEAMVLKKMRRQEKKLKRLLDTEFWRLNYEIAKRKKILESLSACRIHILEHFNPQIAQVYIRQFHRGQF